MMDEATDNVISIRELQRNAAEVMSQVENGASYTISRHGRSIGRLLPPDPAEEAISKAVAEGVLDATELAQVPTVAQMAWPAREPTREPGTRPLSDALAELREDER